MAVAFLGSTPLGSAAGDVVRYALFARNAGAVNGVRADRSPKPNRLVALDAQGRFPVSVLPADVLSRRDLSELPQLRGPEAFFTFRTSSSEPVFFETGRRTTVIGIAPDSDGTFVVFAHAVLTNTGPGRTAINCWLMNWRSRPEWSEYADAAGATTLEPGAIAEINFAQPVVNSASGPETQPWRLVCSSTSGPAAARKASLVAIRVSKVERPRS